MTPPLIRTDFWTLSVLKGGTKDKKMTLFFKLKKATKKVSRRFAAPVFFDEIGEGG